MSKRMPLFRKAWTWLAVRIRPHTSAKHWSNGERSILIFRQLDAADAAFQGVLINGRNHEVDPEALACALYGLARVAVYAAISQKPPAWGRKARCSLKRLSTIKHEKCASGCFHSPLQHCEYIIRD